jgi:hypothetical protein
LASRYSESIFVNSAVTGARRFGGAATITDRKRFSVSTTTLAMRSASPVEATVFLPERLARKPLAEFFGPRRYEKL